MSSLQRICAYTVINNFDKIEIDDIVFNIIKPYILEKYIMNRKSFILSQNLSIINITNNFKNNDLTSTDLQQFLISLLIKKCKHNKKGWLTGKVWLSKDPLSRISYDIGLSMLRDLWGYRDDIEIKREALKKN